MSHFVAYKSTTAGTNLTVTEESFYSLINTLFTSEGVIGTGFLAEQTTIPSNQIKVNDGYILVDSSRGFKYLAWQKNSLTYELANIDPNSGPSNSRRDLIIYHIDLTKVVTGGGGGSIVVVKGTPSGSPLDPNLTAYENGIDKFAIPIARVTITPSTININNGMISQIGNTNNASVEAIRPISYIENDKVESGRFAELVGAVFIGEVAFRTTTNMGLKVNNLTSLQVSTNSKQSGHLWINTDTKSLDFYDGTNTVSAISPLATRTSKVTASNIFY
jgi:hypothetical protein